MSEAICGPSNPLQQFKQQSQVDRTLQQDRLASRHSSSQAFRSTDSSSHLLDAQFEAFQAGPELQPFHAQHGLPQIANSAQFAVPQSPAWAADFQRMQISAPAPMMQQRQPQLLPQSQAPDWATDFRQHISQPAPRAQSSSQSPWAFQQRARFGMGIPAYGQQGLLESSLSNGKAVVRDDFDEAAFAQAFDMVAQELEQDHETMQQETTQHADIFENPDAMEDVIEKALKDSIFDPEMVLGSVAIDEPASMAASELDYNGAGLTEYISPLPEEKVQEQSQPQAEHTRADDDALAHTAGELLDRVKDNQSDKFQKSQFLDLMRKLKDREVRVEGDKMVEMVGATSIPHIPKRQLSPDSGYGSAPSTPPLLEEVMVQPVSTDHESGLAIDHDLLDEHRWDHWESPYT